MGVCLEDSWVREIQTDSSSVRFVLEAALEEGHERFYWPPKPGELHAYATLRWSIHGAVHWNEGPNLERPATDANGEIDFGHIDLWIATGPRQTLEGDWGNVAISEPVHSVEIID